MNFDSWIWFIILVISCIIEAFTLGLTTVWAAIACVPLIFIARTPLAFQWQVLVFSVITVVLIIFTRPFAIKKLKNGAFKTNISTINGQEVIVIKEIKPFEKGEVRAHNGVVWSAESELNETIPVETVCQVVSVEGNTIKVKIKE